VRTHEHDKLSTNERNRQYSRPPERTVGPGSGSLFPSSLLALQRSVGNASMVRALEQAGDIPGAESGDQVGRHAVQRSPVHDVQRAPETVLAETATQESDTQPGASGADELAAVPPAFTKYRQKNKNEGSPYPPDLRMQDRVGRIAHKAVSQTPHVAVSEVPGSGMLLAANTGAKALKPDEQAAAIRSLTEAGDLEAPLPAGNGQKSAAERWDMIKYRALLSGDYHKAHPRHGQRLAEIAAAMREGPAWRDGSGAQGSVHGEMTLLGDQIAHWRKSPWPLGEGKIKEVEMGGVKMACGACQWAFEAANEHIGKGLGYKVIASGTHTELFPGWEAPDWLKGDALAEVRAKAVGLGWSWAGRRMKKTGQAARPTAPAGHKPPESDSEWEEIESVPRPKRSGGTKKPQDAARKPDRRPRKPRPAGDADEAGPKPRSDSPSQASDQASMWSG
jgi:hypothetical protein